MQRGDEMSEAEHDAMDAAWSEHLAGDYDKSTLRDDFDGGWKACAGYRAARSAPKEQWTTTDAEALRRVIACAAEVEVITDEEEKAANDALAALLRSAGPLAARSAPAPGPSEEESLQASFDKAKQGPWVVCDHGITGRHEGRHESNRPLSPVSSGTREEGDGELERVKAELSDAYRLVECSGCSGANEIIGNLERALAAKSAEEAPQSRAAIQWMPEQWRWVVHSADGVLRVMDTATLIECVEASVPVEPTVSGRIVEEESRG